MAHVPHTNEASAVRSTFSGLMLDLTMLVLVLSSVLLWLTGRMDAYANLADLSVTCGSEVRCPRASELIAVFSATELPALR